MPDALLDLVLGSRCAVCGRAGRVLCDDCHRDLPRRAATCWPSPRPDGLARPVAVGEYGGALKLLVNAHKEQHLLALARPLGDLLAESVLEHAGPVRPGPGRRAGPIGPGVVLVPVPSRPAVVRRRGHDPLLRMTRRAASRLRRTGVPARVARVLRAVRDVEDQAGLGAAERASNLEGSMDCPAGRAGPRLGARSVALPTVVVVDDVITTGATLLEAQRALEAAGVAVAGTAVVAATRRTSARPVVGGAPAGIRDESGETRASLPFSGTGD